MAVKPSSSVSANGKAMEVAPPTYGNVTSFLQKNTTFFIQKVLYIIIIPCFPVCWEIPLTVFSGTAETSVHHVLSY